MLAVFHAEDALLRMEEIGRGDIDGIHERARRHRLQRGECVRDTMFRGEGIRRLLRSRANSRQLEAFVLPRAGDDPVGDEVGADHTESDLVHNGKILAEAKGKAFCGKPTSFFL